MKAKDVTVSGESRKGFKRRKNDDRFLIKALDGKHLLLAVSDGMGGHPGGDMAAEDVMSSLNQIEGDLMAKTERLIAAINRADVLVRNRVKKAPLLEGMGATATAVIISSTRAWWAHIGDSRLYLLRGGILQQKTKDHSFLQGQIDGGGLSATEAVNHPLAHVLDQCVGCMDEGADSGTFALLPGDKILLCTDGLFRTTSDISLVEILSLNDSAPGHVRQLMDNSSHSDAVDDTTVIIATVQGPGE